MGRYTGWNKADLTSKLKASITQARANKYHAKKITVDGIVFDSKKEARRYGELKLMQKAGKIQDLDIHFPIDLEVNGVKICTWVCDFVYYQNDDLIYEDTKGVKTPVYKLKKKLFEALFGRTILET